MGASFSLSHVPLPARGASRRAIATSYRRRAALPAFRFVLPSAPGRSPFWAATPSSLGQASRPAVSEFLAGGHSAPGGTPAPPECVGCVIPTPAGAASGPTFITLHESALGGSDDLEYNPIKKRVKSRAVVRWNFSAKAGISRRGQTSGAA